MLRSNRLSLMIHESCCSPADAIPLLEIVRTEKTSLQVIVDLLDVGQKIGKTPVVVGNGPGFAVNRMFFSIHSSCHSAC